MNCCVILFSVFAQIIAAESTPADSDSTNIVIGGRMRSFPSVEDFFPEINHDLTRVTWAHGVDSRKRLSKALEGDVMMIEADVTLGSIRFHKSSKLHQVPVMAHPPAKISDLSFEEFLDAIINNDKRKGIKLDIKDVDVLEQTLIILKSREDKLAMPLWLNADIVYGPVNADGKPVDANLFLNLAATYFPGAVLSVGWTTRYGPDLINPLVSVIKNGSYTFDHVKNLRDVLVGARVEQNVTFPVRAGIAASIGSHDNLIWLLDQFPGSTLTIWGSFYDTVDVSNLIVLISMVGKHRIYIDVPNGLRCQISHYHRINSAFQYFAAKRRSRISMAAFLAFLTYVTCSSSFLPWSAGTYAVA